MCSDLFRIKSSSNYIATLIRMLNQEDAVLITQTLLFFDCIKKREHENREIPWCCMDTCTVLRRIHPLVRTRLVSWIPDNGKNLVPHRTIGCRYFQREDRFFVSHCLAHDAFRFRFYPFAFLRRFIFCSFSSVLFPPIPRSSTSPMNAFGSQERSFSSFRNATLRLPLFSRRISLIFCFLF